MNRRPTRSRRALVLGAAGHLGQAIVRELSGHGHRVTAVSRRSHPPELEGLGVDVARGDTHAGPALRGLVAGHDLVVDAAAPSPLTLFVPEGPEGLEPRAHARERMEALLDAVRAEKAELVFVSSFATLPRPEGSDGPGARLRRSLYPYFRVKREMEQLVLEAAASGLPAVVVNPGGLLGPWEHRVERSLVHQVLEGRLPYAARHPVDVIDVRDVAAAVSRALDLGMHGVPIRLAGHGIGLHDLTARIAAIGGVRPPRPIDVRTASLGAFWGELAWALAGRPPPYGWRATPLIAESYAMRPSEEQRALEAMPRPLDRTLLDAVAWHRARRRPGGEPPGAS